MHSRAARASMIPPPGREGTWFPGVVSGSVRVGPRWFCVGREVTMGRFKVAILVLLFGAIASSEAAPVGSRSIKEVLHGRVEWLKGRRVAVTYDFQSELQLLDFESVNPFTAPARGEWRVEDGKLVMAGSGAFRWKPALDADVTVKFTATPKDGRDTGVVLVEPAMTNRCVVFAIADTFFSNKDVGARPHAHMINCCGVPERGSDRENVFRYVDRTWTPEIVPGQEVTVEIEKRGDRNRMTMKDAVLEGTDVGIRLPKIQVALYVLTAKASWTSLRIEGDLDARWLLDNDVAHDPTAKRSDPEAAEPAAEEPEGPPPGDPFGQVKAWLEVIKNLRADIKDREASAERIIARKRICDVPYVVMSGLLYSGDQTSRDLGIRILKGITGKNLGFSAKLDAARRKTSLRKWWAWIRQNRAKIDKDEEELGGGR